MEKDIVILSRIDRRKIRTSFFRPMELDTDFAEQLAKIFPVAIAGFGEWRGGQIWVRWHWYIEQNGTCVLPASGITTNANISQSALHRLIRTGRDWLQMARLNRATPLATKWPLRSPLKCPQATPLASMAEFARLARVAGFDNVCVLGFSLFNSPQIFVENDLPTEWSAKYKIENFVTVDPRVLHGTRSSEPYFYTSDDTYFGQSAARHGIVTSWSQSSEDGSVICFVTAAHHIAPAAMRSAESQLRALATKMHAYMSAKRNVSDAQFASLGTHAITILRALKNRHPVKVIEGLIGENKSKTDRIIIGMCEKMGCKSKDDLLLKAISMGWV